MKSTMKVAYFLMCTIIPQLALAGDSSEEEFSGYSSESEEEEEEGHQPSEFAIVFVKKYDKANDKGETKAIILLPNLNIGSNDYDFISGDSNGDAEKEVNSILENKFKMTLKSHPYKTLDINSKRIYFILLPDGQPNSGVSHLQAQIRLLGLQSSPVVAISTNNFLDAIKANIYINATTPMASRTQGIQVDFSSLMTVTISEHLDSFESTLEALFSEAAH